MSFFASAELPRVAHSTLFPNVNHTSLTNNMPNILGLEGWYPPPFKIYSISLVLHYLRYPFYQYQTHSILIYVKA
uniref:Uncharacterized protein n=1 Tax=Anguilla anguilla TaxID=7936 RepID=A0A0E9SQQ9_ANGAN